LLTARKYGIEIINVWESGAAHEINTALLGEWGRLPPQWAAIVERLQRFIRNNSLIPDNYAIKLGSELAAYALIVSKM